jgi:hypothetical protein
MQIEKLKSESVSVEIEGLKVNKSWFW